MAAVTAGVVSAPKLVPTFQTAAGYWPATRGGFQDFARLVAALFGQIDQTSESIMWFEGTSYISIFPVLWYLKNLRGLASSAHLKTMAMAGLFAVLSLDGIYGAVFGGIPLLRSQNITSRLVLLSILLFATSLAVTAVEKKEGVNPWKDAYLIALAYLAMTWRMWTVTWDFDAPHY
ncbi:MAG TPA: hypothetical protein VGX21_14810 [Methylomirabilota bacterium]|nr:hypothetical protein [Methylomirabilota bacterium]